MPEVFETAEWFENLREYGFEDPPMTVWMAASNAESAPGVALGLMPVAGQRTGLASLSNYYASLYGPVGDCRDLPPATWRALAQRVRAHAQGAIVVLQPLDEQGAFAQGMARGLREAGYWVDRFFCFGNWYLRLNGQTYEHYYEQRPSALRHSIERGRRRLDRRGGWSLSIHTGAGEGLAEAIAAFEVVYGQSWKQAEPCPQFMPNLMRLAAAQGWLRLGLLSVDGAPVAAQLWLVYGGKANIYKLAYVQGQERFSPGSVLTAAMMRHVIDTDRVQEVDYLTGDDAYKQDWMGARRERIGLIAFDPLTASGLLAAARHFGARAVKRLSA
ncbi:GNAT family N-acetyltransferase [Roseateles toxinivorans]|uniref:CelD/BcsL family acetyltransferase involved in cellulose biosynthesis n=1 Tax=Roseateles toxinivorans TaxID=270368 RepID=A0A4R6QUL5_9BURK|nr:GNAT family N-acetyltransferase [Roseateles toxinivorans]TDP74622.1 CelD/BcsL family acetyltransferase involved in cellulose biosynthesis [Roseateles toxinivorans]